VDDVDLRQQKILIYQSDKTSVGRVVYYSEDAQQALLAWLKIHDSSKKRLFYGQGKKSLSLCYGAARMMFKKYLHKAGLPYSADANKNGPVYFQINRPIQCAVVCKIVSGQKRLEAVKNL
jgi:integrase